MAVAVKMKTTTEAKEAVKQILYRYVRQDPETTGNKRRQPSKSSARDHVPDGIRATDHSIW